MLKLLRPMPCMVLLFPKCRYTKSELGSHTNVPLLKDSLRPQWPSTCLHHPCKLRLAIWHKTLMVNMSILELENSLEHWKLVMLLLHDYIMVKYTLTNANYIFLIYWQNHHPEYTHKSSAPTTHPKVRARMYD